MGLKPWAMTSREIGVVDTEKGGPRPNFQETFGLQSQKNLPHLLTSSLRNCSSQSPGFCGGDGQGCLAWRRGETTCVVAT